MTTIKFATDLNTVSVKELRQFCQDNNIVVEGDRRRKDSYIVAVDTYLADTEHDRELAYEVAVSEQMIENDTTDISVEAQVIINKMQDNHDQDLAAEENEPRLMLKTGFAPFLLVLVQLILGLLAVLVYTIVASAVGIVKLYNLVCDRLFPDNDSFYQQTKELFEQILARTLSTCGELCAFVAQQD